MSWLIKFLESSIGKKFVMAATGLFIALFLIEHLIGNLLLLVNDNGKVYETFTEIMASNYNLPVRIIEIFLFLFFIYHSINGARLWWGNRLARGTNYKVNNPSENSSFFSRFMIWSGTIVFIFLVIHLKTFFFPYRFGNPGNSMYEGAVEAFSSPWYSGFYIIALVLLAFHLIHGVQSAFQTLGLNHKKYTPLIKKLGIIFSIVLCAGFALIPIYFLFRSGGGD
ncbi:MAG TPA: succinate dehydrogenase cytochrome b subunit [Ignavibacteriaceae bacterium]|nr:succinate dehydrogenase cytochrome b subunit [Ignavibacteriaceae bacterium]